MYCAHLATPDHPSFKDRIIKVDYKKLYTKKFQTFIFQLYNTCSDCTLTIWLKLLPAYIMNCCRPHMICYLYVKGYLCIKNATLCISCWRGFCKCGLSTEIEQNRAGLSSQSPELGESNFLRQDHRRAEIFFSTTNNTKS